MSQDRQGASASQPHLSSTLTAMFLVAGCCIGGGMLALPIATGLNGFFPSFLVMLACWLFMTLSALMLVEVGLSMEEGAHIISMTSRLLGPVGKAVAWLLYLFIAYASLMAYTAGGAEQLVASGSPAAFLGKEWASFFYLLFFTMLIFTGSYWVGKVNDLCFLAMLGAYLALLFFGVSEIRPKLLTYRNWAGLETALPLLLTAFSFQTMVPSLIPMLGRDTKKLRWAICGGTTIALIFYVIWQLFVLGIVPVTGPHGLKAAFDEGVPATIFLRQHVGGTAVIVVAEFFAFFAIVTSFLAIGLGLRDFLRDGLHLPKSNKTGQLLLFALFFLPILLFVLRFERIFYIALDLTGGFGDTILNGIIPVLMVWVGRYRLQRPQESHILAGGKWLLLLTLLFFSASLLLEIGVQGGFLTPNREAYELLDGGHLDT